MSQAHCAEAIPFPNILNNRDLAGRPAVASASDIVMLARRVANLIHFPNGRLAQDPVARRSFNQFADEIVDGLVDAAGHDAQLLEQAIGPAIEVGVNPVWRILLEMAVARATNTQAPTLVAL